MTDVKYQRDVIDAFIDGKTIRYRRIKPLNPNSKESCAWFFLGCNDNNDVNFNFEEFEYQIDPPKKIKKWQWIWSDSQKHHMLSSSFYESADAAKSNLGHSVTIIGPALWTETEFDI